jgi:uncharacterized protein (TIGR02271 family)
MAQTVIGIFDNESEARRAVDNLVDRGFTRNSIDIADRSSTSGDYSNRKHEDDDSIGGFFRSLFGSDNDDSRKYSTVASRSCVVTVHAQSSDEAERAAEILDEYGAVDVDERASQFGNFSNTSSDFTDTTTTGAAYTADRFDNDTNRFDLDRFRDKDVVDADRVDIDNRTNLDRQDVVDSETSLPIIEEQLNVGKRVVETGGVRLRSRIIEKPVEESLRLREEHVRVERHPVNRPASEADINGFREGTIEMTERSEVPVVNKEARVVEEVSLNKDVEEREETVRDTVRRTDVEVENLNRTSDRLTDTDRVYNSDERRLDSDDRTLDDDEGLSRPRGV